MMTTSSPAHALIAESGGCTITQSIEKKLLYNILVKIILKVYLHFLLGYKTILSCVLLLYASKKSCSKQVFIALQIFLKLK